MKQQSKQWVSHGVAQKGAHRVRTAQTGTQESPQWGHSGRRGSRTVHVFPNFFAFQAREMKFDEQIWWHMVILNSPWHTVISKTDRLIFVNFHDRGVMKIDEKENA